MRQQLKNNYNSFTKIVRTIRYYSDCFLFVIIFINRNKNKQTITMKTIKINGKDYRFKNTLRAMFIYEQITSKPFKIETLLDNYIYLYSILLANNEDNIIEWNDFINALDEDISIYNQLMEILSENRQIDNLINGHGDEDSDNEKKN